jgi:hypothetical protein
MSLSVAINLVGFQVGWFAVVLGAANGMPWLGLVVVPLIVALHLFLTRRPRQELMLALVCTVLGFLVDSALISGGIFSPIPYVWASPPLSPPWMIMLWPNQAVALNSSLSWMRGRYLLGAVFGAIGGPLAYLGGAKLGAMTQMPTQQGLIILGITWGVMFPLLLWLAKTTSSEPKP